MDYVDSDAEARVMGLHSGRWQISLDGGAGWVRSGLVTALEADDEGLIAQVQASCPDLVLLDWDMPGMTTELRAMVRRCCPHLIVIALSGRPGKRAGGVGSRRRCFSEQDGTPGAAVGSDLGNERRKTMNGKNQITGWMVLMVVLAVGGCGPAPLQETEEPAFGPAFARDAAMATIWTEGEPLPVLAWSQEDITPQELVGSSTIRYTAGEWVVTVTYPIVAPGATSYQVDIVNSASGLTWSGEVDAQGNVNEVADGSADMPNPASVYCEEQGGTVEIRTGADGGQYGVCVFDDGSECDEWAFSRGECSPGSTPPSEATLPTVVLDQEAAYEGVRFLYIQAIAAKAEGEIVAAEEYMGGEVIPEHVAFSFGGYALPGAFHEPRILVYPVNGFTAANTGDSLRSLLDSGQVPAPGGGFASATIPFLPPFNAAQLLHTQVAFVDFQNGRGVRFLTEYAQYYAPINNTDLFYTFQGLTDDGQYYVAAILPVSHPALPADASQIPGGDPDAFANTYDTYANDIALQLAGYGPAEFTPDLALLDAMIASLKVTPESVQGIDPTGLWDLSSLPSKEQ